MSDNLLFERLNRSGLDYIAHSVIGQERAVVNFVGQFNHRPVVWHATIVALPDTIPVPPSGESVKQAMTGSSQYIDISDQQADIVAVEIGLLVPFVDEPTILKVIKMIRLYKNLRPGRHEFLGTRK